MISKKDNMPIINVRFFLQKLTDYLLLTTKCKDKH